MTKTRWGVLVVSLLAFVTISGGITAPLAGQTGTGTLQGRITDTASSPVPNSRVVVIGTKLAAVADVAGRYRIENIPAGAVSIRVSYIGYKPRFVDSIAIVADASNTRDVTLSQSPVTMQQVRIDITERDANFIDGVPVRMATGTIQGRILDSAGISLPGMRIILIGSARAAYSDSTGHFVLADVPVGTLSLRISGIGYKPTEVAGIVLGAGQIVTQDVSVRRSVVVVEETGLSVPVKPEQKARQKPAASHPAPRHEAARRRLMRELYEIAQIPVAPMPLRAGRAGLLLERLVADDQARLLAEIERLRPRRSSPKGAPVPIFIASHGDLNGRRPGM
ncbi:MAG: carboxypeptidase-like regulatory domain-containing protein [Gemmatimonadales bacterium]